MMENDQNKQNTDASSDVARDLLHNKSKLQSLRTYQGDVANIIKSQNESITSIAIKEKVRDEEEAPKVEKPSVGVSFMTIIISLVMVAGSAVAILFVWKALRGDVVP